MFEYKTLEKNEKEDQTYENTDETLVSECVSMVSNAISCAKSEKIDESCKYLENFLEIAQNDSKIAEICNKSDIASFLIFMVSSLDPNLASIPLKILILLKDFPNNYYTREFMELLNAKANECTMFLPLIEAIYRSFVTLLENNEDDCIKDFIETGGVLLLNSHVELFPDNDYILGCIVRLMQILLDKKFDPYELMPAFKQIIKLQRLSDIYVLTQQFIKNEEIFNKMQENGVINDIFQTGGELVNLFKSDCDEKEKKIIINNGIKIFGILLSNILKNETCDMFCFDEMMFFVQCNVPSIQNNAIDTLNYYIINSQNGVVRLVESGALEALFGIFYDAPFRSQSDLILLILNTFAMLPPEFIEVVNTDMWDLIFDFVSADNKEAVSRLYDAINNLYKRGYSIFNFDQYRENLEELAEENEIISKILMDMDIEYENAFGDPGADI